MNPPYPFHLDLLHFRAYISLTLWLLVHLLNPFDIYKLKAKDMSNLLVCVIKNIRQEYCPDRIVLKISPSFKNGSKHRYLHENHCQTILPSIQWIYNNSMHKLLQN
jgi:hypothetical protein